HNADIFTPSIPETPAHEIAREYTRESRQQAMRERVDDMEAVKKMVESLSRHEDEEAEDVKQDESSTNTELTMQELLARSEELLSEIRAASDEALEEKLSALAESSDATEQD